MDKKKLQEIRDKYTPGTKIRLIEMDGEPQMKAGLVGRVVEVDDIGQIHMHWETGSSLALNLEVDNFAIIND